MLKNKNNKALLIALVLGDGYLRKSGMYLDIEHSGKQIKYLLHKKQIIEKIFGCQPLGLYERYRYDKRTEKIYHQVKISKNHKYFKVLRRLIYSNNQEKYYSQAVLNFLTPEALAIWYQDDGFLNGKYIASFATYCSEGEADNIIKFFKEKYSLEIKKYFHKHMKSWYMAFTVPESNKFKQLIEEFIIPEMRYKLPAIPISHER